MKSSRKQSLLMASMPLVDEAYIAEAAPAAASPMIRLRRKVIRKYTALAACLCAVLILGQDVLISLRLLPTGFHLIPQYTASEIASVMGGGQNDGTPTNAYEQIYAPIGQDPTVSPVPDTLFSKVYAGTVASLPLKQKSLTEFTDGILARLAESVNGEIPTYTVEKDKNLSGSALRINGYRDYAHVGGLRWEAEQNSIAQTFDISAPEDALMELNGIRVEADFRMTDDEMEEALTPLRDELFRIFGVEFKDFRVDRNYNGYDPYSADRLTVYFYDSDAAPLNEYLYQPASDFIEIHVYRRNYTSGQVDDPISSRCSITYTQYRTPPALRYTVSKVVPTVSLARAEELLKKGYVFGNHNCEICMAAQDKIDFENYDFVGLTYHTSYSLLTQTVKEAVPFYAFYKKLNDTENGLTCYAVTYVPAVEIVGYEQYFKKQKENHREPVYMETLPTE